MILYVVMGKKEKPAKERNIQFNDWDYKIILSSSENKNCIWIYFAIYIYIICYMLFRI